MYRGKPIGARFEQMVSKTTRIVNSVRDWHVPFAQFTLIYREPGTSLAIGPGPGTGRKKKQKKKTTTTTIFCSDIPVWTTSQDVPFIFGNFPAGQTKIA